MDKSIIKKDIAALIKTINEQYAAIENTMHCSQQQTAMLVHSVEQLHKKTVVFDFVNSQVQVAAAEIKIQPTPAVKPVEKPIIDDVPAIEKIIVKETSSVPQPIQQVANIHPPVAETKKEEPLPVQKPIEEIVNNVTPAEQIAKEQVAVPEIKSAPKRDIKTSIGINDKFEFISELFKGNAADYEASIQLFNSAVNNEVALKLVNDLQKKYNLQEDNETLSRFLEIIKKNVR